MKKTLWILLGLVFTGIPTLGFSYDIDEAGLICELLNEKASQPLSPKVRTQTYDEFFHGKTITGEAHQDLYDHYKKEVDDQNNKSILENQKIQMAARIHSEKCTGSDFKHDSEHDQNDPVDQYKDQHE